MFVAILNDGTYSGDAPLLDWTFIPVAEDEVKTVTLEKLVSRREGVYTNEGNNSAAVEEWDAYLAEENDAVSRAFILDEDVAKKIINCTDNVPMGGDTESYAVNSAIIGLFESFATRVVVKV